jgi:glycosyltransferase involved in cell wall biosynthesis
MTAYNEERRIKETLDDYLPWLNSLKIDYELLVVVEGKDRTRNIVEDFMRKESKLKCVYSPVRLGKGGAVKKGFQIATGDIIGYVDADLSINAENFNLLLKSIGYYDGVIASRKVSGSKILTESSALQRFGSFGFNLLTKLFLGLRFKDTQCGAKLFKSYVVKSIIDNIFVTNFAFDVDILYNAAKRKFRIKEIPINWTDKPGSVFSFNKFFWGAIPQMFVALLRIRFRHCINNKNRVIL